MPGPPPGGYLSACYVQSWNGADLTGKWPSAMINPQADAYSACSGGHVAAVFAIPGGIGESAFGFAPPNTSFTASGPYGDGDIGGAFQACNTHAYCLSWATTWIGTNSPAVSLFSSGPPIGIPASKLRKARSVVGAAFSSLAHAMPTPSLTTAVRQRWLYSFRALTVCMRSHGVADFPYPSSSFGNGHTPAPLIGPTRNNNLDPMSTSFTSASQSCQEQAAQIPVVLS